MAEALAIIRVNETQPLIKFKNSIHRLTPRAGCALLAHTYMDVGGRATQDAKAEARIQLNNCLLEREACPWGMLVFTSTTTKVASLS